MADLFVQFWRLFTDTQVPVFGVSMTASQLAIGFFVTLFSIFVIRHFLWR